MGRVDKRTTDKHVELVLKIGKKVQVTGYMVTSRQTTHHICHKQSRKKTQNCDVSRSNKKIIINFFKGQN